MFDVLDVVDSGLDYCRKGWFVLPIKNQSKEPITSLVCNGHLSATDSGDFVASWWNKFPDMNIGIACEKSNLIVLDIDYRNMNHDSWEFGKELSCIETMQVETGDGLHLYFTTDALSGVRGKLDVGIDIKYKGYVVAAPSVHPNGKRYEANGLEPVALPNWLKERVCK